MIEIGGLQRLARADRHQRVERLTEHREDRVRRRRLIGARADVDRDGDIRPHVLDDVGRDVVERAAVHQQLLVSATGVNTAGIDIVARSARENEPEPITIGSPARMSVATQRNGVGSSSKFLMAK